jgi:hypothetical protein
MLPISRSSESNFFDNLFEKEIEKVSFSIERISYGYKKEDPFEDSNIDTNTWKIKGNKLMKKINK